MFIQKKRGGSNIEDIDDTDDSENDIVSLSDIDSSFLTDNTKVILGDTIELKLSNKEIELFTGTVIYNDTEQLIISSGDGYSGEIMILYFQENQLISIDYQYLIEPLY